VILKSKRRLFREYAAVIGGLLVQGWPHDCGIVLDQHAVEERRDPSRFDDLTFLQLGGRENDIIYLPLAGLANGIHERRRLTVDSARHTVGVSGIIVGIEHLAFVAVHEKDPSITLLLRVALLSLRVAAPFNMELAAGKLQMGPTITAIDDQLAVLDRPGTREFSRRILLLAVKLRGIFAVKQNDRVRRCIAGFAPGGDDGRCWTIYIMNLPLRPGDYRRICIAQRERFVFLSRE